MTRFAREISVAEELARAAGALSLRYHNTGVTVDMKPGDEPVTRADREASELIVAGLRAALPGDIIISEEADDDPRRLEPGHRVWFVDPIDGTRDFIKGRAGFAVMIGLCIDAQPVVGVIFQPIGGNLFVGSPDGAYRVDEAGVRKELRCSTVSDPAQARLVASKSHRTPEIDQVKSVLGISNEMNIGSVGLKLGLIALDERDLYVNPSSHSKAWDTCAPQALLEAAGGKMTDLAGAPLHYDRAELANDNGLVASNGPLHAPVLEKIVPLFKKRS
jgi:3'(2'), 5'-bisphosphate nucleotidase